MSHASDAAKSSQLTFVLPLALSGTGRPGSDAERSDLLLRSMARFVEPDAIAELLIVSRSGDREAIAARLAASPPPFRFRIVDETHLCPELALDPATEHSFPAPNRGWIRQQVLKLAAHQIVETEFFCTLDSDILFARPCSSEDLLPGGRAPVAVLTPEVFRELYSDSIAQECVQVRVDRDVNAETTLRLTRRPELRNLWYGETPVLYATELIAELALHIEREWRRPWREVLLEVKGWTEHSLYYLFAESTGGLDRLHTLGGSEAVLRLRASLWHRPEEYRDGRSLETWNLDAAFDLHAEGFAVAVQSYLGYPVEEVAARILPRLSSP